MTRPLSVSSIFSVGAPLRMLCSMSEKSLSFFCLSLMVSSSTPWILANVNRSCTAQFLAKGFSGNCLEHWTPIHWWQLKQVTKTYYALATKPVVSTKQLFQSQVHVGKIEAQNHGNLINNYQLKTSKGAFHNFLRGLGQRPVTCLPALMLDGKMKAPVNGHSSDIKCRQSSGRSNSA